MWSGAVKQSVNITFLKVQNQTEAYNSIIITTNQTKYETMLVNKCMLPFLLQNIKLYHFSK